MLFRLCSDVLDRLYLYGLTLATEKKNFQCDFDVACRAVTGYPESEWLQLPCSNGCKKAMPGCMIIICWDHNMPTERRSYITGGISQNNGFISTIFYNMKMKYINVIDNSFDTRLFKDEELKALEQTVFANKERMQQKRSVRIPGVNCRLPYYGSYGSNMESDSTFASKTIRLPKYSPPPLEKARLLQMMDSLIHNHTMATPHKPAVPVGKTNTAMSNYVHKLFVYETYLINQLDRQKSYHRKYNQPRHISLKHHYDRELSRQISRSLSMRNGSRTWV